jgi:hypothetical protein
MRHHRGAYREIRPPKESLRYLIDGAESMNMADTP